MYDLNNEIADAFLSTIRDKPTQAVEFVGALQTLLTAISPTREPGQPTSATV